MTVERIYISCCKADRRLAAICVASVRYWYPDLPIFLIRDFSQGRFDSTELEQVYDVQVFKTAKTHFGWGFAKLEPLFERAGGRFLVIDSDTVLAGPVLDDLNTLHADFIVDDETQPADEVRRLYFDLVKLREIDPDFQFPGETFNSGQWVGTPELVSRDDFGLALDWHNPPRSKYPECFKNGDQGILNYVLSKSAQTGAISLKRVPLMLWASRDIDELDLQRLKSNSPYRKIIHWAGSPKDTLSNMPRHDVLEFFEQLYYSRVSLGSLRRRWRAASQHVSNVVVRGTRKLAHLSKRAASI